MLIGLGLALLVLGCVLYARARRHPGRHRA
jgi:hypothetical protein